MTLLRVVFILLLFGMAVGFGGLVLNIAFGIGYDNGRNECAQRP